jgi:HAD superfamily hydrolase (TIGR01509 family)
MKDPSLVIFDLDGVLVDTLEGHFRAWAAVASILGVPFSRQFNDRLRGVPRDKAIDLIAAGRPPLTLDDKFTLMKLKEDIYIKYIIMNKNIIIINGVNELLGGLRRAGISVCVASASRNAGILLELAGLHPLIDGMSDGYFAGRLKPYPDQLLQLARQNRLEPADCMVVEDAVVGAEAARRAGMRCLAVGPVLAGSSDAFAWVETMAGMTLARFREIIRNGP